MTSARLAVLSHRRTNGIVDAKHQQRALDDAMHLRLLKAARQLSVQWRKQADGSYRIPPGAVLALLKAVDESWDVVKGVER